jgi:hypothetical protein
MNIFAGLATSAILIFSSFFSNVHSTPDVCRKHLQVIEASQARWNPGIVLSNNNPSGGIIYTIKIKIRTNGYVTFNNLITGNETLAVEVEKDGTRTTSSGTFTKGDVITLIARSDRAKTQVPPDQSINSKLQNRKAEAAILYSLKEKQHLHPIDHLAVKESHKLSQ